MPDLTAHYSAVSINELILFTTPEFTRIKKRFKARVKSFFSFREYGKDNNYSRQLLRQHLEVNQHFMTYFSIFSQPFSFHKSFDFKYILFVMVFDRLFCRTFDGQTVHILVSRMI